MIKTGLNPVYNDQTEILIVGTFPSEKSLQAQQYYNNPRNKLWEIMSALLNVVELPSYQYKKKLETLFKYNIGLWDTVNTCEREGSLDKNIKNPIFNDFSRFNNLKIIVCNGGDSFKYASHCKISSTTTVKKVISSSPAAAIAFEKKFENWLNAIKGDTIQKHIPFKKKPDRSKKMSDNVTINKHIQDMLNKKGLDEVSAVEAAKWLDEVGILNDSTSRPGLPLRKRLRDGKIRNAEHRNGRFWFIHRMK